MATRLLGVCIGPSTVDLMPIGGIPRPRRRHLIIAFITPFTVGVIVILMRDAGTLAQRVILKFSIY